MRRTYLYIFIFIFVLSLAGCARNSASSQPGDPQETTISESTGNSLPTKDESGNLSGNGAESTVLTFVKINDVVPQYDTASTEMFTVSADRQDNAQYEASYIHLPNIGSFEYANGVFTVCTDEVSMKQGNHNAAYVLKNGQITEIVSKTFSQEYDLFGTTYQVEFAYAEYDGQTLITYSPACYEANHVHGAVAILNNNSCLVDFTEQAATGETMHHLFILDLNNGNISDLYSCLSPDMQKNLLCNAVNRIAFIDESRFVIEQVNGPFYYVNTVDNVVRNLDSLLGFEIKQCSIVGERVVCWNEDGDYWKVNTADLSTRMLLEGKKDSFASGIWYKNGCSFTIYKDAGKYHIFDFASETDTAITPPDGWELRKELFQPSPDGRGFFTFKLEDNGALQLLVFDCDFMRFVEICRTNLNAVHEAVGGWTSDGKIVIRSDGCTDFYIYDLK